MDNLAIGFEDGSIRVVRASGKRVSLRIPNASVEGLVFDGPNLVIALGQRDELVVLNLENGVTSRRRPLVGEAGRLKRSNSGAIFMDDSKTGRLWRLRKDRPDELIVVSDDEDRIAREIRLAGVDGRRLLVHAEEKLLTIRIPE